MSDARSTIIRGVCLALPLSFRRMTVPRSRSLLSHGIIKSLVLLGGMTTLCGFLWASGPSDVPTYSIDLSVIDEKNQPVRQCDR